MSTSKLVAQLWAMSEPAEGLLLYGIVRKGTTWYEYTESIELAIHWVKQGAEQVRGFWKLP